jgi:acyl dehydratase
MAIDPQALLAHDFGRSRQSYEPRDAILYALGLGLGADPCDPQDLPFLDETDLEVLPTFAVTLCTPGMWIREPAFGVDFTRLVHASQRAEFLRPLPPRASVVGEARVVSLCDRGQGRGAVLDLGRVVREQESGLVCCRLTQTLLLRGDGGFGGPPCPQTRSAMPERPPDAVAQLPTSRRAALIYRLSGDWNPLHLRPDVAREAGFERPILQGLASYGMAAVAVSRALSLPPQGVSVLSCRFCGVVAPGDELNFSIWRVSAAAAAFCASVGERKVLDEGEIEWRI